MIICFIVYDFDVLFFITVDAWNDCIGDLNPELEHELIAECAFSETDDIHGYLSNIMTEDTMEMFDRTGIPPHKLKLKVKDFVLYFFIVLFCCFVVLLLVG